MKQSIEGGEEDSKYSLTAINNICLYLKKEKLGS